ncbi:MAG: GNAT family N-acetyltransferase [Ferruginibacter sp.]
MPEIIEYESKYAVDFKKLNLEWLDKYGLTEAPDLVILDDPQKEILDTGGCLYLARVNDKIVGSAALIAEGEGNFELAKMAVIPNFQGMGISKLLIEKCLEQAKILAAKRIYLVSNSQLKTALLLYEKYGFRHVTLVNSHYHTADTMMELSL